MMAINTNSAHARMLISALMLLCFFSAVKAEESNADPGFHYEGEERSPIGYRGEQLYKNGTPEFQRTIPKFDINLDLPPEQRFVEVGQKFKTIFPINVNIVKDMLPSLFLQFFWVAEKVITPNIHKEGFVNDQFRENYLEMKGLAYGLEIPLYDYLITNFLYEVNAHCNGFVVNGKGGQIIHGRSIDFHGFEHLRENAYEATFYKDGKVLYKASMLTVVIGTFTIMKPGKFAITSNERNTLTGDHLLTAFLRTMAMYPSPGVLLREVAAKADSYEEAAKMLKFTHISSSTYFILSGVERNQGMSIARGADGLVDVWKLNDTSSADWVIITSNVDHWNDKIEKFNMGRYDRGYEQILKIGKDKVTPENMFTDVLQVPGIFTEAAIYSTVMIAKPSTEGDPSTSYMKTIGYF